MHCCPMLGLIIIIKKNSRYHGKHFSFLIMDFTHSIGKKFGCSFCDELLMAYDEKQHHLIQCHREQLKYCLSVGCSKFFESDHLLLQHNKIAHKGEMLKCTFCESKFLSNEMLLYHVDEKHENETANLTKLYTCPLGHCQKKFRSEFSLNQHAKYHARWSASNLHYLWKVCRKSQKSYKLRS